MSWHPTSPAAPSGPTSAGFPAFGNIFCPAWMGFSPILAGIRDIDYDLTFLSGPVTVAAGKLSRGNQMPVDSDADYLVREIQFSILATAEGLANPHDMRVRIRDGDGRLLTSDFVPVLDMNGPFPVPWPLRRGAVLIFDFLNLGAVSETVGVLLKGWKRLTCDDPRDVPAPYQPLYSRYLQPDATNDLDDWEYPFSFSSSGAGDQLRVPLQTDNDADFLWRAIAGDWNTVNGDVATVGNVGLTFYDVGGLPLSQYPLTNPWGSNQCGLFRESLLSNGGGRPSPFYPEIFIPRGGVVLVDLSFGAPATVRFSLRGMKVYGHC